MLDEKKIGESKRRIEKLLESGDVFKGEKDKFSDFFLTNAQHSFDVAQLLYAVSTTSDLKNGLGFPQFNGFLWIINASYYSMFFMVRVLLEKSRIKIKTEQSIHLIAFDAFITYFYATGKIERQMVEEFEDASVEALESLGKEKAKLLVEEYANEREKRSRFTYEMGEIALQNKAKTSLERARRFNETLRKMI